MVMATFNVVMSGLGYVPSLCMSLIMSNVVNEMHHLRSQKSGTLTLSIKTQDFTPFFSNKDCQQLHKVFTAHAAPIPAPPFKGIT